MGPLKREWGFLRRGRWWHFEKYIELFGGVIRCDEGPTHVVQPGDHEEVGRRSADDYKTAPPRWEGSD